MYMWNFQLLNAYNNPHVLLADILYLPMGNALSIASFNVTEKLNTKKEIRDWHFPAWAVVIHLHPYFVFIFQTLSWIGKSKNYTNFSIWFTS